MVAMKGRAALLALAMSAFGLAVAERSDANPYCSGDFVTDHTYYVPTDFVPTVSFVSNESTYLCKCDQRCDRFVVDVKVSYSSYWCKYPESSAPCPVYLNASGFDVPSSLGSGISPHTPTVERDCITFEQRTDFYFKELDTDPLTHLGTNIMRGSWGTWGCSLYQDPASTHPPTIQAWKNSSGPGWHTYRLASELRVRGSSQQIAVLVHGAPPT